MMDEKCTAIECTTSGFGFIIATIGTILNLCAIFVFCRNRRNLYGQSIGKNSQYFLKTTRLLIWVQIQGFLFLFSPSSILFGISRFHSMWLWNYHSIVKIDIARMATETIWLNSLNWRFTTKWSWKSEQRQLQIQLHNSGIHLCVFSVSDIPC